MDDPLSSTERGFFTASRVVFLFARQLIHQKEQEGSEWSKQQGDEKPVKSTAVFSLSKSSVDQCKRSPANPIFVYHDFHPTLIHRYVKSQDKLYHII